MKVKVDIEETMFKGKFLKDMDKDELLELIEYLTLEVIFLREFLEDIEEIKIKRKKGHLIN